MGLTPRQSTLMRFLRRCGQPSGGVAPSLSALASELGCGRPRVLELLRQLEARGHIRRRRVGRGQTIEILTPAPRAPEEVRWFRFDSARKTLVPHERRTAP